MRLTPIIFLSLALVGSVISFVGPWHQWDEPEEWDDGEHIWGRNIHNTSIFVNDFGDDVPEDKTGILLRQAAFWAAATGITLSIASLVFAAWDRRGWCLWLGWPAFILTVGAAGAMVSGMLYELTSVTELNPSLGMFGAVGAILYMFVGNILGGWLGQSPKEVRRKAARKQLRDRIKADRAERKAAVKAARDAAIEAEIEAESKKAAP